MRIETMLLPDRTRREQGRHDAVVVIDTLRATTTFVAAFEAGVTQIEPVATVEDARSRAAGRADVLLCGERDGLPPEGFSLGNSPMEFLPQLVAGRSLIVTTTNGTAAIESAGTDVPVLTCALVNLDAVRAMIIEANLSSLLILCAGNDGRYSSDDAITAGALLEGLFEEENHDVDDGSRTARILHEATGRKYLEALRSSDHGNRLIELGFEADLEYAAMLSRSAIVPRISPGQQVLLPS